MVSARRLFPQALPIMLLAILLAAGNSQMFSSETQNSIRVATPDQTTADWLLEKSNEHPDGFQLLAGSWQFPRFGWRIATTITSSDPTIPENLFVHIEGATQAGSRGSDESNQFDEQLLELVQSLMNSVEKRGALTIYEKQSAGLRGVAVCRRAGDEEIPEFVSLQWPASESLWTELTLRRDESPESLNPILPLPTGSRIYAQRLGIDQMVHYQAADVPTSQAELAMFLLDHGFDIRQQPENKRTFRAEYGHQSFELTCRELGSNHISVLLRRI